MYETPRIVEVKALKEYYIYIKFKNEEEKVYNMEGLINNIKFFHRLKKRKYFENVHPRGDTVEWKNGEDVAPENLYYDSIPISEWEK